MYQNFFYTFILYSYYIIEEKSTLSWFKSRLLLTSIGALLGQESGRNYSYRVDKGWCQKHLESKYSRQFTSFCESSRTNQTLKSMGFWPNSIYLISLSSKKWLCVKNFFRTCVCYVNYLWQRIICVWICY